MLLGVVLSPLPALAVDPIRLTGAVVGRVTDAAGVPQMGAAVFLYNRFERLLERGLTNERGNFLFADLAPDTYSVRVSLSTYVPALKRIAVQPGIRSFVAVSLTSVLSSIELVYAAPGQTTAMSEDWKWTLRSATSTRPVLRLLPGIDYSGPRESRRSHAALFTDTRGVLRVSAGDGGALSGLENQPDLGTAFALATSLFGSNHLHFSGNLGYGSDSGIPTAGFRGSFSRHSGQISPEVNVTMRQMFLPARIGMSLATGRGDAPVLKTVAVSMVDRVALTDALELHYGASLESVSFVHRLSFFSPFARLSWDSEGLGTFQAAYSSGVPAAEMLIDPDDQDADLQHHLSALSLFPRVSLRGGRAHVQRTANIEAGWRGRIAGRTAAVSLYREDLSNAATTMAAPGGYYSTADLLPDISSSSSIFNIGGYRRSGVAASLTQPLGEDLNVTLAWGAGGALEASQSRLATSNPDELRSSLRRTSRQWLAARFHGVAPRAGTRFSTSYQWTDYRVLNRPHLYLTQKNMPEMGLNIHVRQPIPALNVFSARLEATAELRNLLAEGYVPVSTSDGSRVVLIPSPRAVRGGLSFIF